MTTVVLSAFDMVIEIHLLLALVSFSCVMWWRSRQSSVARRRLLPSSFSRFVRSCLEQKLSVKRNAVNCSRLALETRCWKATTYVTSSWLYS